MKKLRFPESDAHPSAFLLAQHLASTGIFHSRDMIPTGCECHQLACNYFNVWPQTSFCPDWACLRRVSPLLPFKPQLVARAKSPSKRCFSELPEMPFLLDPPSMIASYYLPGDPSPQQVTDGHCQQGPLPSPNLVYYRHLVSEPACTEHSSHARQYFHALHALMSWFFPAALEDSASVSPSWRQKPYQLFEQRI